MRAIYMSFLLLSAAVIFLGSSSGPGAVQGQDRTGGPLANGFCGNCHAANAFNPTIDVKIFQGGSEVDGYMPGETYTMQVTINADAGAQVYGFQAVALSGADNVQAGSWTEAMGTQVTTLSDRDYIEHNQRSDSNVFEVEWTAPSTSVGAISFWSAGIAANNAQGSGGDGAARLTDPVVLADLSVGTNNLPELAENLKVFPNPALDELSVQLEVEQATDAQVVLYNSLGQPMLQLALRLASGLNQESFNLSNLPAGHYTLEVSNSDAASRTMVLKK